MKVKTFSKVAKEKIILFLDSLRQDKEKFLFKPVLQGITDYGDRLELGFSTYALKIYFMTGEWDNLKNEEQDIWIKLINSYQINLKGFPINSFIDQAYLDYFKANKEKLLIKDLAKKTLNKTLNRKYELTNNFIINSVRAETKQCIATLYQVGAKNNIIYSDFEKYDIHNFLDSFDWSKPWSAGAQFSGLAVFSKTQIDSEKEYKQVKKKLIEFIGKKVNDDGAYYYGMQPSTSETINGAMKVLTGLDWLDEKIHYPDKLIDICLNIKPKSEGCDLVDIVYVLYRCSLETTHRRKEIITYFEDFISIVESHYFPEKGGFSYYLKKSQTNYYGVEISKGFDTPDIHGTILLIWSIAMMSEVIDSSENIWKIIKP